MKHTSAPTSAAKSEPGKANGDGAKNTDVAPIARCVATLAVEEEEEEEGESGDMYNDDEERRGKVH